MFASDRLGLAGIWKVGSLGGDATLVLANAADPAVSPDGTRLAFCRTAVGGIPRIFVVPLAATSEVEQLTFAGHGSFSHTSPAWSPDGQTICYATYGNLWLVAADGGEPRGLTEGGTADSSPAWSTDGRFIYFSSQREGTQALWRVAVAGGEPVRLTPGSGPETGPCLAASGSVLAYATGTETGNSDVVIYSAKTGDRLRWEGLESSYQPALSADGTKLCYVSNRWQGRRELWLQDLRGGRPNGDPRRLTDQPGIASLPRFSTGAQWLVYYRIYEHGRGIWIVPLDGRAAWPLTDQTSENIQPA